MPRRYTIHNLRKAALAKGIDGAKPFGPFTFCVIYIWVIMVLFILYEAPKGAFLGDQTLTNQTCEWDDATSACKDMCTGIARKCPEDTCAPIHKQNLCESTQKLSNWDIAGKVSVPR